MLALLVAMPAWADNLFVIDGTARDVKAFDRDTGTLIGVFGQATSANLMNPVGLTFHPANRNLLVGDTAANAVQVFNGLTTTFEGPFGGAQSPNLGQPTSLAFHPGDDGDLFVVDMQNNDVRRFDNEDGAFEGIFGDTAMLGTPRELAFHPTTHNLMVTDRTSNDVKEFNGTTGALVGSYGDTLAQVGQPRGLAFNPADGHLFVSDGVANDVKEFDENGTFVGSFGATAASAANPGRLLFHPVTGNLLVADGGMAANNGILEFNATTGALVGVFGDTQTQVTNARGFGFQTPEFNKNAVSLNAGQVFGRSSSQKVVAPYWQADSGSYTFLAVSHPSLTGMGSEIGVVVNAVLNDRSGLYGPAARFTIESSESQQVFITTFNNVSINPGTFPDGVFITGTTASSHGSLVFNPVATSPQNQLGGGYRDITMLDFWGAVVVQSTVTGFAMEFIGDNQDSRAFNTPYFSGVN